jgi:hypothetical protein
MGRHSKKIMKTIWFKRWGWFYRPVSLPGVAFVTAALLFCAQVFWAVDRKSHSVSDTLLRRLSIFCLLFPAAGLDRRKDES